MIRNPRVYDRAAEEERLNALRSMTAADSIAVGEALLTSDLMRLAKFPDDDHPCSLVIALGIRLGIGPSAADGRVVRDHGAE